MDTVVSPDCALESPEQLIQAVSGLSEEMRARRPETRQAGAPLDDLDRLRRAGLLRAVLPRCLGGFGFGTEPEGTDGLLAVLRLIGRGDLSLGRLFEGHVNAVQLVLRYGNERQVEATARDVTDGHLHAIWNTEIPPGVRRVGQAWLSGRKSHCSAAGVATRGLITVDQHIDGGQLLLARLQPGERSGPVAGSLHGMRGTRTGWVDFECYVPGEDDWIGQPGDYMREPVFSGGAWRTLAVLLGGLESLVEEIGDQLTARRRDGDPRQRARLAEATIARQTAYLWVAACARLADGSDYAAAGVAEYVNLARRAVEAACLDAIRIAQRSLGLAAFVDSNPVEPLMRDLATYLRQPAMDEALDEAAAFFMVNAMPSPGMKPE
jgi:alkylation response protein AidB-like acyl-CoA dehydrogenase